MAAMSEREKEICKAARRYRTLRAKRDAISSEMDELKTEILKLMDGEDSYNGTNISVKTFERTNWTFDKDLLHSVLGSNLRKYQNPKTSVTMLVK